MWRLRRSHDPRRWEWAELFLRILPQSAISLHRRLYQCGAVSERSRNRCVQCGEDPCGFGFGVESHGRISCETSRFPSISNQIANRAAQTGVFELDIRNSNWLFIDVCKTFAAETGLKRRNVETKINAV
jgi:hypothetical protein